MNPTSVEIIAPVLTEAVAEEGAPLFFASLTSWSKGYIIDL